MMFLAAMFVGTEQACFTRGIWYNSNSAHELTEVEQIYSLTGREDCSSVCRAFGEASKLPAEPRNSQGEVGRMYFTAIDVGQALF